MVLGVSLGLMVASLPSEARQNPSSPALSPTELAGKKLFLQRCSLCHLRPVGGPPGTYSYGPPLNGFVNERPQGAERVTNTVRRGTGRMPGFQYGLESAEIEAIVAYLKTMR